MCTNRLLSAFAVLFWVGPAFCEVLTSEFLSAPQTEGWTLSNQWGEVTTWIADGVYYQDFPNDCPPGPVCASQSFTRPIDIFNDQPGWFYEYRVLATADNMEIPNGAPTVLSAFNAFGNLYHCTVSSDKVKLSGDADLPIVFLDVQPGQHTIRLELFNDPPPSTFHWYVDSVLVLEGLADSPFPDFDARITWQGRTWMQPTLNAWYYIRAGDIPIDGSADFDSDGQVDDFDVFYIDECIQRSADGEPAAPSCIWADIDGNGAVTCDDWDTIAETLWTGANPPPELPACTVAPIPAVSQWGVAAMMLTVLGVGTLVFRHRCDRASS